MKIKIITAKTKTIFAFVVMFLGIILLTRGQYLFGVGFHNIDLAWNIKTLNYEHDAYFIDYGEDFTERTDNQLYEIGTSQIVKGMFLAFWGVYIISFMTAWLVITRSPGKKNKSP